MRAKPWLIKYVIRKNVLRKAFIDSGCIHGTIQTIYHKLPSAIRVSQHALTEDCRLSRPWQIWYNNNRDKRKKKRSDPCLVYSLQRMCPRYGKLRHKHTTCFPYAYTYAPLCIACSLSYRASSRWPKAACEKSSNFGFLRSPTKMANRHQRRTTIELNVCVLFVGGKCRRTIALQ